MFFFTSHESATEAFLHRVDRMQLVVSFVHPQFLIFSTAKHVQSIR